MSVTDRDRRNLYDRIVETIGETEADILMELLPHNTYNELATRDDVLALASTMRGEMGELRGEIRGEMSELRAELKGEMAELRAELRGDMTKLNTSLSGELAATTARLQRWAVGVVAANCVAIVTAVGAIVTTVIV